MAELLEFLWPLHRAGYVLQSGAKLRRRAAHEVLLDIPAGEGLWIVPGGGGDSESIDGREPLKLGLSVFRNMIDSNPTPESALLFTDKYGFLLRGDYDDPQGMQVASWLHAQENLRKAWSAWEDADDIMPFVTGFNAGKFGSLTTKLSANRTGTGLSMILQPDSLWAMMWVEFALHLTNKSGLRQCEWCGSWFPYGTGTGRRSKARFCTSPCRKANHLKSKREA